MGSEFCSVEETANRLGCCKKSVFNYIKKGFLTVQRSGRTPMILKKDVEQMALDLGSDAPALNRQNWFKLYARLEKVEREMITVKHILEIRDQPLRVSAVECVQLYNLAVGFLERSSWSQDEMELWGKYFESMDEVFLKALTEANQDPNAWQPIFKLCVAMLRFICAELESKPTVSMQALFMKLDEGRKKLRGTVLVWVSSGLGNVPEAFLATLENPVESVARRLGIPDDKKEIF